MIQVRVGISYCKVQNDTVKSLVQPKSPLPWVYAAYRLLHRFIYAVYADNLD